MHKKQKEKNVRSQSNCILNGHVICIVSSHNNNIHTTHTYLSISVCEVKPYISISYICIIWAVKRNILTSKRVHCFDCCPVIPVERCLELEIKITRSAKQEKNDKAVERWVMKRSAT